MFTVKILGMIFLAVYLIISGLVSISGTLLSSGASTALDLLAVLSGLLILISSICKFSCCSKE